MFRCAITGELTKPGEQCFKVVTHVARVEYAPQEFRHGKRSKKDPGGMGYETLKEANVSFEGMQILKRRNFKPIVVGRQFPEMPSRLMEVLIPEYANPQKLDADLQAVSDLPLEPATETERDVLAKAYAELQVERLAPKGKRAKTKETPPAPILKEYASDVDKLALSLQPTLKEARGNK